MKTKLFLKKFILIFVLFSMVFPLIVVSEEISPMKVYSNSVTSINMITIPNEDLKIKSGGPYQVVIDDMEDLSDWGTSGPLNISRSTDATQGTYSMNITYPCNATFGVMQIALKNVTPLNINFSNYDTIEFDAKFINTAPFSLTLMLKQPPAYDTGIWYRNVVNDTWQHYVIDITYFQFRPLVEATITYDAMAFMLTGNTTVGTNVTVLIDNLKVCGTGVRLSSNQTYSDVSEGATHTFTVNISRLLGTGTINYTLYLDRSALVEFRANLSQRSISLPENGTGQITVDLIAPDSASIDSTEHVILWIRSTTDVNKNHSLRLIAGVKRNLDKIYFISDINSVLEDIYYVNPDGTNLTRITGNDQYYEEGPMSLSSSGTYLTVARNRSTFDINDPSNQNRDIWFLNTTDMILYQITNNSDNELHIDFSPNETHMSYNSNHSNIVNWTVCTMKMDLTNFTEWTNTSISCWDIAWSHNDTEDDLLAFGVIRNMTKHEELEIYLLNLTDQKMTRITNNSFTETDPYFSADDTCLLYDRYIGSGLWYLPYNQFLGPWEIVEYNLTSDIETQIYTANGIAAIPCYSPDNTEICFSQFDWNLGIHRLMIMNRDGSNPHHLKYLDREFNMRWQDWGPRRERELFPDAEIVAESMRVVGKPNSGGNFKIQLSVRNVGEVNLNTINISFYQGFPNGTNNMIGQVQMIGPINISDTINVQSSDLSIRDNGEYTFYALLLAADPKEYVTSNNIYNITVNVMGMFFLPPFLQQGLGEYNLIILITIILLAAVGTLILLKSLKKK